MMQFRPTLRGCADVFQVSEDTVSRLIHKEEGLTFKEFKEKYSEGENIKLQMKAVELAYSGNTTMLIFCLKNLAGWGDVPKAALPELKPIPLAYVPLSERKKLESC